jgi:RNA polymerase subunit RPABC4/transcription elongation factor Spt4
MSLDDSDDVNYTNCPNCPYFGWTTHDRCPVCNADCSGGDA